MSIQFINGTAPIYFDYTAPKPEPVHTQRSFFIIFYTKIVQLFRFRNILAHCTKYHALICALSKK